MKNLIMRILAIFILTSCALVLNGCRKDNGDKFTIKGKFLNSCDNPTPVSGHQLFLSFSYGINNRFEQIAATTQSDGSFEFAYDKKNTTPFI